MVNNDKRPRLDNGTEGVLGFWQMRLVGGAVVEPKVMGRRGGNLR